MSDNVKTVKGRYRIVAGKKVIAKNDIPTLTVDLKKRKVVKP